MPEPNHSSQESLSEQPSMIQVLLVDDDPFIRESLNVVLGLDTDIYITGTASNGTEALACLESGITADVVLMDIRMPECDGVEGTLLIKTRFPDIQVLMLTTFDDDEYIIQALQNGASGYLLKRPSCPYRAGHQNRP